MPRLNFCGAQAFFGFLFLWQGSFLAPFGAHLAVQAVYLWGVGHFPLDRESRRTWQIPGTKCRVCGTSLRLLQIKLDEEFECAACKETLSLLAIIRIRRFLNARRQGVMRGNFLFRERLHFIAKVVDVAVWNGSVKKLRDHRMKVSQRANRW